MIKTEISAWEARLHQSLLQSADYYQPFFKNKAFLAGYQKASEVIKSSHPEITILNTTSSGIWVAAPLNGTSALMPISIRLGCKKIITCALINKVKLDNPIFTAELFKWFYNQSKNELDLIDPEHRIKAIHQALVKHNFQQSGKCFIE